MQRAASLAIVEPNGRLASGTGSDPGPTDGHHENRAAAARTMDDAGAFPAGSGTCNWPIGEPGTPGFRFCGRPTRRKKPYCATHCARAYRKPSKREERDLKEFLMPERGGGAAAARHQSGPARI